MSKKVLTLSKKKIVIYIVLAIAVSTFCIWQNNALTISDYQYASDKVSDAFDGYRIVQVSDLHNKQFGKGQKRLLDKIKSCQPDMIVVTGDVVHSKHIDVALQFMHGAVEIAPVYFVTGNHENWLDLSQQKELMKGLDACGVIRLDNEKCVIEKDGESLSLIGLKDENLTGSTLQELAEANSSELAILLAHEPQNFALYQNASVDLIFSGHAHGGQVRLPFVGGLVAPDQGFFPYYDAGVYEENGTTMVVSRGLGNSVIPLRVFNHPEIVCVELKKVM